MSLQHISCAPGINIGEEIAAEFIRETFKHTEAILLNNYHHSQGKDTDEIDLVLINERGVWLLESKHWYGHIEADQIHWYHTRRQDRSPISSIEMKAKRVASTIRNAGLTNISVSGLVVLTVADTTINITDPRAGRVVRLDQSLIDAVTSDTFVFGRHSRKLSSNDIKRVSAALIGSKVDPQQQIIGSYRLLRELEPGEGFTSYEAQHVDIAQRRARVKCYQLTGLQQVADINKATRRFQQDIQALMAVEGHPNVVRAYDFFPDTDTSTVYWLLLEWIDGPTIRDLIDRTKFNLDQQLGIMLPLARAVEFCHRKGIIHRNITPSSVYLLRDPLSSIPTVKLSDFDFARVPTVGTISVQGQPLVLNKYTAPEIRENARAANERSDIYALGALWYAMALRGPEEEPVLLSHIDQANLPDAARKLLRALLAPQPMQRPGSVSDVVELLNDLTSRKS